MTKAPLLTGKKLIGSLKRMGFEVIRIKGSHHFVKHPDGRATVVPVHAGETIGRGLLAKILRDTEIDAETLRDFI